MPDNNKIIYTEQVIQGAETYLQLPKEFPEDFSTETTPDVANKKLVVLNNGSATSISNFLNGQNGQLISLLALTGNTTVNNNANIKTNTGSDKTLSANKVYLFTYYNNVWYEAE